MNPEAAKHEQDYRCAGCWRPLVLMGLSVLVTVVVLEILLRLGGGRPSQFNAALASSDRSPVYHIVSSNRLHPWSRNCPDPLRIAIIGDSFTVGAGVQPDDTYVARLERMLNANAVTRPAEVNIYAVSGTSTYMQFGLLRHALTWKPQVVVLGLCLNDTEDWTSKDELQQWRVDMSPRLPSAFCASLLRHSRLFAVAYGKIEQIRMHRGYIRYYRRLYDPAYSGWGRFAQAVEYFHNDCRNEGVTFVVLIFPLLSEPFDRGRYPFEFVHAAIHRLLEEKGIPSVDLLETMRGKLPVRMQAIPNLDPHPSEIGHRIAAEMLMSYLLAGGYIDRAYAMEPTDASLYRIWKQTAERMDGGVAANGRTGEPKQSDLPP